jgi:aspartate kinase
VSSDRSMLKTVVQKFGGSSLATAELREIAASRVLEARSRGLSPVVVCSAMGRSPDPYATDTLLGLLGPSRTGPNRDLMLGCGELISSAVFAELLNTFGVVAQAMSGGQAGFFTDDAFGDANIAHVDPRNIFAALERGIIPVVAGFQGMNAGGALTTLGRGGSDLSAIALGHALGAESVDIYTDVSGVMTGDPRRIVGAHAMDRVNYAEMTELAAEGAKVMHHRAADWARVTDTSYAVKGLRSNVGTVIDEGHKPNPMRPVTGVTAVHDITFFRIIPGDIDDAGERRKLEIVLFGRIAERDVSIDMININNAGIFFVCNSESVDAVRSQLIDLNLAVRVRPHCAKISVVGAGMRGASGVMYRVVQALVDAGIEIIQSTDSNITISVLVAEDEVVRAQQAIHDAFKLGRSSQEVSL